jgi:ATPase subunit of ABC transporter with duplicated ATPase domains
VSHDRAFLDSACTDVLHISGYAKRLTQQRGSYTTWAKRRKEQQEAWEKSAKDRADQRQKMYDRANVGFRFGGSDMNKQEQLKKQIARSDEEKRIEDEELKALNEDEELPLKLCAVREESLSADLRSSSLACNVHALRSRLNLENKTKPDGLADRAARSTSQLHS